MKKNNEFPLQLDRSWIRDDVMKALYEWRSLFMMLLIGLSIVGACLKMRTVDSYEIN